jgi:NADH:ubiquinone oxidoreductase subunit 2 (subunit N)
MSTSGAVSIPALTLAILGGGIVVLATALAMRPRRIAQALTWVAIAGLAHVVLGLAVAVQGAGGEGLVAAVLQFVSVIAAVVLVGLAGSPSEASPPRPGMLSAAGRGLAWLTLVGLPPSFGFHGKLLIYRALMRVGWDGLALLAMASSAVSLIAALWAIRGTRPAPVRGPRAVALAAAIACVVALGVYPEAALAPARLLSEWAAGAR